MGGRIRTHTLTVTTTGGAGVATGSAVSGRIEGYLLDMYVDWSASAPGTSDITVKQTGRAENLWALLNSAADVYVAPRLSLVTSANAAISDGHDRAPINGTVTVSVADCDALAEAVVVTLRVHEL